MKTVARKHGTNAKYHLERCRCYPCCLAASSYEMNRRRAIAYGRWQPFVDAEPVRQHVRALGEFGMGWIRVAKIAGVSTGGVSKLLYGDRPRNLAPTKRIRPETALKLLAVEPTLENLGFRVAVDGAGTRRRLQALVASGWTQSELARRMGMQRSNFGRTIVGDLVVAGTVRATLALYDELWRLDPCEHGVPRHRAEAARRRAAERGWVPVGAWDDDTIDDPAATPDHGDDIPLNHHELSAARRDEIRHLSSFGVPEHEIAARVGLKPHYVHKQLTAWRKEAAA